MRLSEYQILAIKEAVYSQDPGSEIYLFGSRVDDTKQGGDIDLLVISEKLGEDCKFEILDSIYAKLGEQKIDLLISNKSGVQKKPLFRIALKQGVLL